MNTQEAQAQLDLAQVAFEGHLYEQAAEHLRRVLEIDPAMTAARILEARLKLLQNKPRMALAALDANDLYHAGEQSRPDVTLLRIEGLVRDGVHELALNELEKFAAEFADDLRPHQMIAALCTTLGMNDRAIQALTQVVRLNPSDRSARMNLVRLISAEDPETAIRLLTSYPLKPDLGMRLRLARLYHASGRDREAEDAFAALLIEAPQEEHLWREAGALADSAGDHTRAIRRLKHAVELSNGHSIEALMLMATTHMNAGESIQAGRCWWQAARQTPDNSRAWAGLLLCAFENDRINLVRRVQKVLTLHTSKRERQHLVADQWQRLAGGTIIRRALRHEITVKLSESPLAQLLSKATQSLETHLFENPKRADTHYHLATCRAALEDRDGASVAVAGALAINPNYAAAAQLQDTLRRAA